MKRLIILATVIFACKDSGELEMRPYPFMEIAQITTNSAERITADVRFLQVGTEPISDFGFVWHWTEKAPHLAPFRNEGLVLNEGAPDAGGFSQDITHQFRKGQIYFLRSFTIGISDTTYSASVPFLPNP